MPAFPQCLKNRRFARLYVAQAINLAGDALTWLGLALLAFELAGDRAGGILSTALTLRVTAFVVLAPLAGALADRLDRKTVMAGTHLARLVLVCGLPFATQSWQLYLLILALNSFAAFFTPTYSATVPLVTSAAEYPQAMALSSATYQLLGVLGPGLAGSAAALVGTRQIFFLDGLTFLLAAGLILTLPGSLRVNQSADAGRNLGQMWRDVGAGSVCLFRDPPMRYALLTQGAAAMVGAAILVNSVGYVQGVLGLGKLEYGWVMAAFGLGATAAALLLGVLAACVQLLNLIQIGAALTALALLPAGSFGFGGLVALWALAGLGQTWVNAPTQMLIAERVAPEVQGRVYGAQFAWSHFWWALAYPLAGWLGETRLTAAFGDAGWGALALIAVINLALRPQAMSQKTGQWHDHSHRHLAEHGHLHGFGTGEGLEHSHPHFHAQEELNASDFT